MARRNAEGDDGACARWRQGEREVGQMGWAQAGPWVAAGRSKAERERLAGPGVTLSPRSQGGFKKLYYYF
jgi:hypothetical protein